MSHCEPSTPERRPIPSYDPVSGTSTHGPGSSVGYSRRLELPRAAVSPSSRNTYRSTTLSRAFAVLTSVLRIHRHVLRTVPLVLSLALILLLWVAALFEPRSSYECSWHLTKPENGRIGLNIITDCAPSTKRWGL